MIKTLSISGFRGFGEEQIIKFALPSGKIDGSGLSIITGANNSGKTTIIESIRAFNNKENPSFSEGKRNIQTNQIVKLRLVDEKNKEYTIESIKNGGSSTNRNFTDSQQFYVVQSRRAINFEFDMSYQDRSGYIAYSMGVRELRSPMLSEFPFMIFQIEQEREKFDPILERILGKDFKWIIEQTNSGNYYIKYSNNGAPHSSEGIGDGVWSVFTICAALYNSPKNSTVVIDEPELSVHPAVQKRLMELFVEYSNHLQIIICTHSPYFINWHAIANGAELIRVVKEHKNCKCYCLQEKSRRNIRGILNDLNNPHTLGIDANEIFFLEDKIILVEGQEDVVIYNRIAKDLKKRIDGNFFGWGVGGASKMNIFLTMFQELGFKKVTAIFDGDKRIEAQEAQTLFPNYHVITIDKDDIRDKDASNFSSKCGLTDKHGNLKQENKKYLINLIDEINQSFD